MQMDPAGKRLSDSGELWFVIAAFGSVGGGWLAQQAVSSAAVASGGAATPGDWAKLVAGVASIFVAGFAVWRLARIGSYSWLLPVAAVNLWLLRPGRAGDVRTWRLEWSVMGLVWTLAAVLVFARLLRRSDELERRLHLEAASLALGTCLLAAVVYGFFENHLPVLRAQWVAVAMLLAWWGGFHLTALKYRWRA